MEKEVISLNKSASASYRREPEMFYSELMERDLMLFGDEPDVDDVEDEGEEGGGKEEGGNAVLENKEITTNRCILQARPICPSPECIKERLLWGRELMECKKGFWETVVFYDRCRFLLVTDCGASLGVGASVWSAICIKGKHTLQRNMIVPRNTYAFLKTITDEVVPFAQKFIKDQTIYIQYDNTAIHNSKVISKYFLITEGVESMDWPTAAHELSPFQPLWRMCARTINKKDHNIATDEEMFDALKASWDSIPQERVDLEINACEEKIKKCVENKGLLKAKDKYACICNK